MHYCYQCVDHEYSYVMTIAINYFLLPHQNINAMWLCKKKVSLPISNFSAGSSNKSNGQIYSCESGNVSIKKLFSSARLISLDFYGPLNLKSPQFFVVNFLERNKNSCTRLYLGARSHQKSIYKWKTPVFVYIIIDGAGGGGGGARVYLLPGSQIRPRRAPLGKKGCRANRRRNCTLEVRRTPLETRSQKHLTAIKEHNQWPLSFIVFTFSSHPLIK